ncbi:caspase family protein [Streptomyces sp. W16]|uniref:caspase family protein n=1 Tax=Streptomyces sp. W16 TaxID=3076631 RepID=UPI00295B04E8|nr:caspase family protein [Streptomyces sp. W16]MDV9177668.1 caspase family protein [Streptomyces sp. W16]
MRLPEPRGSRAILIGTSEYDSEDLCPLLAVRNNLDVLRDILTAEQTGGFLPGRCTIIQDATDPREVCRSLREAAAGAPDTLLVYFAGHGILSSDLTELHLALTGTDQNDLRWTSIPFQAVREILDNAECRNKILILDCCHSGWALDELMGPGEDAGIDLDIHGVHVLASASRDEASVAPPGERYTAFTGELIRLLRDGLPAAGDPLPLTALYTPLTQALKERGYPRPKQQGSDHYGELGLVRNRASTTAPTSAPHGPALDEARHRKEIRFTANRQFASRRSWALLLTTEALLITLVLITLPRGNQSVFDESPRGAELAAGTAGATFLIWWATALYPAGYCLAVRSDGIDLRCNPSRHFYYPWHAVARVWILPRRRRLRRRLRYEVMVRLKPGVLVSEATFATAGPRNDRRAKALRFADLRRIAVRPEEVDLALSQCADLAWTPCPELGPLPPRQIPTCATFTSRRVTLAAIALLCGASALNQLTRGVLLTETATHLTGLTICAALLVVCTFAVMRVRHPARLTINGAGIEFTCGETALAYAWSEVSRIGVVPWPPGSGRNGVLAIRPAAQAEEPIDRTNRLLPRLTAGTVTICPLYEVTTHTAAVEEALVNFASDEQLASNPSTWMRTSLGEDGQLFRGRLPRVWVNAAFALVALPTLAMGSTYNPVTWVVLLRNMIFLPLLFIGAPLYVFRGANHVLFRVTTSGFDLQFLQHRVHVPWRDVERIGLVVRHEPLDESIMVWLRPGVKIPKPRWSCLTRKHGGLRVLSLQKCRIDTDIADIDQAIARYAGRKHSHIMYIHDDESGTSPDAEPNLL